MRRRIEYLGRKSQGVGAKLLPRATARSHLAAKSHAQFVMLWSIRPSYESSMRAHSCCSSGSCTCRHLAERGPSSRSRNRFTVTGARWDDLNTFENFFGHSLRAPDRVTAAARPSVRRFDYFWVLFGHSFQAPDRV